MDGCPRRRICLEGIERDEDIESRIDDHRSWGGASGVDEREISMVKCQQLRSVLGQLLLFPFSNPDQSCSSSLTASSTITTSNTLFPKTDLPKSRQAYLDTIMSAAIALPKHKLSESPNSRSIEVGDWFITASTNPISNASESDTLQAALGFPLPEMTFGSNYLTLEHRPSAWKYSFSTEDALRSVKKGELEKGDGGVKVEYADKWLQSR